MQSTLQALSPPDSGAPAYRQIREILREFILTSSSAGDRFPTDLELCQRFGVSRNTVRQAVDELVRAQLLVRIQGKGTFVRRPEPVERMVLSNYLQPWSEGVDGHRLVIEAVEPQIPDPDVRDIFHLAPWERVIFVKRRRETGGQVAIVDYRYFPHRFAAGIDKEALQRDSITDLLRGRGLEITASEMEICARPTSHEEALDLGVEPGEVVLVRQVKMQTPTAQVVLYGHSIYQLAFARLRFSLTA